MSLHPNISTSLLTLESSEKIQYKGYEEKFEAKLLWSPFFEWDPHNYDQLVTTFENKIGSWFHEQGLDYFDIIQREKYNLKGMVALSMFLPPPEWRKEAMKDMDSLGAKQTESMLLATIATYLWDDLLESTQGRGSEEFYELKQEVTDIVVQIMSQDFENLEEVYRYLRNAKKTSRMLNPKYKTVLAIQQKLAENLKDTHGIKTKDYPYLVVEYRMIYDSLTMCAGNGVEVFDDPQMRDSLRCCNSGGYAWIELFYALSKLKLEPRIREDKYLKRIRYLAVRLLCLTNDIVSLEREVHTENSDNIVIHFVDRGHELVTAMEMAVKAYNDCFLDICEIKDYLDSGKHPSPTDAHPAIAAHLDKEYREAIRLTYVIAATNFQAQMVSNRYTRNWRFD